MKYLDNTEIMLGDIVVLDDGSKGVVVCSLDNEGYSKSYSKEEWSYLKQGVLIDFEKYGLIHYSDTNKIVDFTKKR